MSVVQQGPTPNVDATVRGLMTPADKVKIDALTGTNTGDVSLAAVGAAPNANGASLVGQVIALQPANASFPGVVTTVAQTFAGPKTFNSKVILASQGGANAIEIANQGDYIRWGDAATGPKMFTTTFLGETALRYDGGPVVILSGQGFCMGGVNSSFGSSGVAANSQSYLVDVYQTQPAIGLSLRSSKGGAAGVVVKIGTSEAPHANAELVRIGHGLGYASTSDGTAVAKFMGDNTVILGAKNTAPTDANLMAGSISFYLDETGHNLKVRVKYADGATLKTGTLAVV